MTLTDCPDPQTLEQLLLGKLPAPDRAALEEHLLDCPTCIEAADTVNASDELTECLRARRTIEGEEDLVAQVIERGSRLRSEAETVESAATLTIAQSGERPFGSRSVWDEEIDFLAPPELPDEIGRLGGYRILEVLGVGGMGVVFRAEDPRLKRHIALKAMKPSIAASRSARNRFVLEAQAAAALDHDHIVHIYQVGEDRGIPFIAMQHLRGESLQTRLDREGRIDQSQVLRIGRETATGLAAAHERGLIHRDIKPDNIWLEGAAGRVKILDFGLARTADDAGLTQSGMVVGTPRYMAPEQAQGQAVDPRCDLFSLGGVLYHLVAGKPPFAARDPAAMLLAVVTQAPAPLSAVCPDLHPDLMRLIHRLLSKDRAQRPATARATARAIAEIEKGLAAPTVMRPSHEPVYTGRSKRAPYRHFYIGAAAGVLMLAAFVGLWAAGVLLRIETSEGALVVNVTGDGFATSVQGQTITVENVRTGEEFLVKLDHPETTRPNLKTGEYQFVLESSSGIRTRTNRFTIRSGKETEVEVWWEPLPRQSRSQETAKSIAASSPAVAPFDAQQAQAHQDACATRLGVPAEYTNSLGMKFRLVPPGEFMMGSTPEEIEEALPAAGEDGFWQDCFKSEGPQHRVILTQPFYLAVQEVTQDQFKRVMGRNPSAFTDTGAERERVKGLDTSGNPVEQVTWIEATEFCARLSRRESLTPVYARDGNGVTMLQGSGYRLPTEAEWEFACRAGTITRYSTGDRLEDLSQAARFNRPEERTHAAGELAPNPFGLYDMHGNVYEWVQDWWTPDYYEQFQERTAINPTGPVLNEGLRVARGGDWFYSAADCRSSARWGVDPVARPALSIGFRVVLSVEAVREGAEPAAPAERRAATFVEAHGITGSELEAWRDRLPPGFRPVWIGARTGSEEPLFDAVAVPDAHAAPWELHVLTGDSSSKYQEMSQTHRLALNMTFQDEPNGNMRLWVKDNELWSYWFGDAAFIDEQLVLARDVGAPPASLSVTDHGDYATYEAAFGPHRGLKFDWELDLGGEELAAKITEYRTRGWRPQIINTHLRREPLRFLAVFVENPAEIAWDFSSSLTPAEYESHLAVRREKGFLPQCVCSWTDHDAVQYAAVWVQEQDGIRSTLFP